MCVMTSCGQGMNSQVTRMCFYDYSTYCEGAAKDKMNNNNCVGKQIKEDCVSWTKT